MSERSGRLATVLAVVAVSAQAQQPGSPPPVAPMLDHLAEAVARNGWTLSDSAEDQWAWAAGTALNAAASRGAGKVNSSPGLPGAL